MIAAAQPPTDYGLPPEYEHVYSGKVRDLYRTPDGKLLFALLELCLEGELLLVQ